MKRPGAALYHVAEHVSDRMRQVLDAWLADFQFEYARADRWWKRAWVRLAYTTAWMCAVVQIGLRAEGVTRALACQLAGIVILTFLMLPLSIVELHSRPALAVLLVPSALVVALSLGSGAGALFSLGRRRTVANRAAILVAACVYSLVTVAVMQWVLPNTNQAFRVGYAEQVLQRRIRPLRGHGEMSLTELAAEVRRVPWPEYKNVARLELHMRLALIAAPMTLTWFLVSVARTRFPRVVGAVAILIAYAQLNFERHIVRPSDGEAWMLTVVWGPTLLLLAVAYGLNRRPLAE